jgi:cell fate regulator YaaT (PSP1 superfamily)
MAMNPICKLDPPKDSPKGPPPKFVLGVRVKGVDKSVLCDPGSHPLRVGTYVMIATAQGDKFAVVASNKLPNFKKEALAPVLNIIRVATEQDLAREKEQETREATAREHCLELIRNLKLPMNLSRVMYLNEDNKSVFFFTAEGRVDFRELVKQLAGRLKHRIEMRQVGVRDEARSITGYGTCGQALCCSTFLDQFSPVTIRMAKDQGLALNPSKISGVCGRLMCCLQYEHANYKELIKEMPKLGSRVQTADGPGKVIKQDILKGMLTVRLEDESILYYHLDEIKMAPKPAANSEKSPS